VKKVQRYVDHALCKLPFEEAWFRSQGCNATYVGHPYFDELHAQHLDPSFLAALAQPGSRVVTLLPGSRTHEVKNNLPMLLRAGAEVRRQVRNMRLVVASYNDRQAALARELVAAGPVPAEVWMGRTAELISAAECCLACSGSVSLELLFHARPSVIVYRVPWLTYHAVRPLIRVPYMSLVNLLASDDWLPAAGGHSPTASIAGPDAPLFPEYPTWQDRSAEIAGHAIGWLTNEPARQHLVERLLGLRQRVACGGASQRAAQYITEHLAPAAISRAASAMPLRRAS
jgi:lipid-A-disaccharide synthase